MGLALLARCVFVHWRWQSVVTSITNKKWQIITHKERNGSNTGCCWDKHTEFRYRGESSDSVQLIEEGPRTKGKTTEGKVWQALELISPINVSGFRLSGIGVVKFSDFIWTHLDSFQVTSASPQVLSCTYDDLSRSSGSIIHQEFLDFFHSWLFTGVCDVVQQRLSAAWPYKQK